MARLHFACLSLLILAIACTPAASQVEELTADEGVDHGLPRHLLAAQEDEDDAEIGDAEDDLPDEHDFDGYKKSSIRDAFDGVRDFFSNKFDLTPAQAFGRSRGGSGCSTTSRSRSQVKCWLNAVRKNPGRYNYGCRRPSGMRSAGYMSSSSKLARAADKHASWQVVKAWMCSSGHRKNILNREFQNIGIGVRYGRGRAYWCTLHGKRLY